MTAARLLCPLRARRLRFPYPAGGLDDSSTVARPAAAPTRTARPPTDPAHERSALEARQPHGRLISADEVADTIVYLANPLAGSTNGVTLSVDAGIQSPGLR
jgi:NAD(P)-dependent dehydrogenase (short-subunit alcohol dehydrogenase family)